MEEQNQLNHKYFSKETIAELMLVKTALDEIKEIIEERILQIRDFRLRKRDFISEIESTIREMESRSVKLVQCLETFHCGGFDKI